MKRKAITVSVCIALAAVAGVLLWIWVAEYKERRELSRRIENIRALMEVLKEAPELSTVSEVVAEATRRGIQLFNPEPLRPIESLYRVRAIPEERPDAVLVEEVGVESRWVVQGLSDGSVVVKERVSTR